MLRLRNVAFLLMLCCYGISFAQTTGPSQPEVQSFQAASITNMVETSTGQFQYNIPLFTIGSYPVNINYNSRVTMDQEASMVGLGFNLNCGAITRQVRGIPDDFNGDQYFKRVNMKENVTKGINLGFALELVGMNTKETAKFGLNLKYTTGLFYNSYTGFGIESTLGAGFHGNSGGLSGNAGVGITSNSQHGTSVNPYCGLSYQYNKNEKTEKGEKWKKSTKKTEVTSVKNKTSIGGSIGYNFNSTSYNPKIELPFKTRAVDFSVKVGIAGMYIEGAGDIKGYIMKQSLETNKIENPAYGFLYAEKGKDIITALMDFNRENDGIMTETKPNLPLAYGTPDVYSVTGQGVGGIFELKRNNIFIGFDPAMSTNNISGGLEIEMGFGTGTHVGADLRFGYIVNTSKKWNNSNNEILGKLDFTSVIDASQSNKAIAEQVYFKNPNDVMFNRNPVYNITAQNPFAPRIKTSPFFGGSIKPYDIKIGSTNYVTNNNTKFSNENRDNRTDVIYYLTAKEASDYGIEKTISSFTKNDFNAPPQIINRVGNGRADDHLSELICLKTDGTRYVFDKPAYNMEKRDVSFSINDNTVQNYLADADLDINTPYNPHNGIDEYISVTETPAYAHSFLLGSVLSPNYIDVDDNGPTKNDIGDYVKFNYTRLYTDYYWRTNNEYKKAAVDLGNLADPKDGKAFYSEGKKEVWYIHSIESKNEISRFYYSNRVDAIEINGNGKQLQQLDSVLLFTRPEIENNIVPVPFKKIYFSYNTTTPLCNGVLNSSAKNKLTLDKVYFKDGISNKGKYSAYQFSYDNNANPPYNTNATDRWGNYKPDAPSQSGLTLDNKDFPFTNQDNRVLADKYAASWLLKNITLPGGGKITIDYEAHDYAYVQNKRAMYMTPVIGVRSGLPTDLLTLTGTQLYHAGGQSHNFVIFKLKKQIPGTVSPGAANYFVKTDYLTDNLDSKYGNIISSQNSSTRPANLYGKFRVSLGPNGTDKEDIPVFLDVKDCGALLIGTSGNYEYGYVELRTTYTQFPNILNANQIAKTAWQFTKNNYPRILLGMDADPALSTEEEGKALADLFFPVGNIVKTIMQTNPNQVLQNKFVAQNFVPDQSYIRLYEPTNCKIGGNGARVKQITINDNWSTMSASPDASYTIKYDYKKEQNGVLISSGVASYEPEIGGEENPWKQPVFFNEKNVLMPDDNKFIMTPFGESLFPSADINYSEVKTTQNPIANPSTQQGTGYTINKYYTFYDFPCKVDQTQLEMERKPKISFSLLKNISFDYMLATQGYVVITNDMQGKPKSEEVFGVKNGSSENLISGKYYKYKTDQNGNLFNKVRSVDKNGNIQNQNQNLKLLGVETQTFGDVRSFETESFSGSVHGNLDFQMISAVPTIVPSFWPDFSYEQKQYASFSITKHIRTQGILDSVIAVDKGSRIYTKNELWDEKTGAVLLTQTINEFKDPVYNFTYPAHWAYSGMGMASDNISAGGNGNSFPASRLQIGDIVAANGTKYVIQNANSFYASSLYAPATILSNNTDFKIISSGRKNLATTSIGSTTSLINPDNGNVLNIFAGTNVIDANAFEFTNKISLKLTCNTCNQASGNNYLLTDLNLQKLAPWQQLAAYKFVADRNQNNSNPVLRKDGTITLFDPFWNNPAPGGIVWSRTANPQWQYTSRLSYIDNKTKPVESYNPLKIFSSGQPSNIDGQTYAVTNNARYFENFFENFEEQRDNCNTNHFQLPIFNTSLLDNTTAHTGYYSMKTQVTGYQQILLPVALTAKMEADTIIVKECAIQSLSLVPGKQYIFTAWVKQNNANNTTLDYTQADVTIVPNGNPGNVTCSPKGQIIDGWQHMELEFTAPSTPNGTFSGLTIKYAPNCNYDDIRIYPADAIMKSYVYSYKDYSLMAILDESNFATFYEYDQQKQLKRVKKETEKGIVTIQEVNFGSFKQ